MNRKKGDIQKALDNTLSGLERDTALLEHVLAKTEETRRPVRRLTPVIATVLVLVLLTGAVAIGASYRGVGFFLTEKAAKPVTVDENYLLENPNYYHTSKLLDITVVDAYWDGLEFYVAYRIGVPGGEKTVQMEADGTQADYLLIKPHYVVLTDAQGKLKEPDHYAVDWVNETDGAVTIMVQFQCYDMMSYESITVPVYCKEGTKGDTVTAYLHIVPDKLDDPLNTCEHAWAPATCLRVKICTLCGRTEGEPAPHEYLLSDDGTKMTCRICGKQLNKPTFIPQGKDLRPGEEGVFVLALQLRLNEEGYYAGAYTGVYDEETKQAVMAYQETVGIIPDGICGMYTVEHLFHSDK